MTIYANDYSLSYVEPPVRRGTRQLVLERDLHRCVYCGRSLAMETLTIDHIVAKSVGGSRREFRNLAAACYACNKRKKNLPLSEFHIHHERRIKAILKHCVYAWEGDVPDPEYVVDWCVRDKVQAGRLLILELMRRMGIQPGQHIGDLEWPRE